MVKVISWNVNSIRKGVLDTLEELVRKHSPDVICFQETKGKGADIESHLALCDCVSEYKHRYYSDSIKGHAGVALWSKEEPSSVSYDIGGLGDLAAGRVVRADFGEFVVLNTYVPNSGTYEDRRHAWHTCVSGYLEGLGDEAACLVWCGDLNVVDEPALDTSHHAKRPSGPAVPAGLKQFEKDQFDSYKTHGLVDSFRHLHPDEKSFTWFSPRRRDVGWRLDYFMLGRDILEKIKSVFHGPRLESTVSDHTWLLLEF